jgi:general stress protein 26
MDNRDAKQEQWAELLGKIRDIKFAMLTTLNEEGFLHSRPMATLEAGEEGVLWFFTGRTTLKAREIAAHPRVNLAYSDGGHDTFVSLAGEAHLVGDRGKAEELWNPIMKAWFPQGLDDPDLVLMRVDVEEAEYWDTASKRMTTLIRFAKSLAGHAEGDEMPGHGVLHPGDRFAWDG